MKKKWATLSVETMYVMSILMYDFGRKDDAIYWFYSAQFRARLLGELIHPTSIRGMGSEGFERIQGFQSFFQLVGEYIIGYAFGNLDSLKESISQVITEAADLPNLRAIYPSLELIDDDKWPAHNRSMSDGLGSFLSQTTDRADDINSLRKRNKLKGQHWCSPN